MKSVWLMYHDVTNETPTILPETAMQYHVTRSQFIEHMQAIQESGQSVITIRDFLQGQEGIVLTFDDGWHGSLATGIPLLGELGLKATYFITRDFIGRERFCQPDTLRWAAKMGMEIGVHGTTHRMLTACSEREIVAEFEDCKQYLESLLERPVEYASLPGGDWNKIIATCAQRAGLRVLCTSRPRINNKHTSRFALGRIAVKNTTTGHDIARYCRYNCRTETIRWQFLQVPRRLLGSRNYVYLRRLLLDRRKKSTTELFKP